MALEIDINLSAIGHVPIYSVNKTDIGMMNLIFEIVSILIRQKQRQIRYQYINCGYKKLVGELTLHGEIAKSVLNSIYVTIYLITALCLELFDFSAKKPDMKTKAGM